MLVGSVLEAVGQSPAVGVLLLFAPPLPVVSAVATIFVRRTNGIDKGNKSYLLILLILCKFLRLVFLLLSRLLSLGCRLGQLCLGMHLLDFGKIGVPEIISAIYEPTLFGART